MRILRTNGDSGEPRKIIVMAFLGGAPVVARLAGAEDQLLLQVGRVEKRDGNSLPRLRGRVGEGATRGVIGHEPPPCPSPSPPPQAGEGRQSIDVSRRRLGVDRPPDALRRRRHFDMPYAKCAQGIHDGIDGHRQRRRGAAFARGADAERMGRRRHLADAGVEGRELARRAAWRSP